MKTKAEFAEMLHRLRVLEFHDGMGTGKQTETCRLEIISLRDLLQDAYAEALDAAHPKPVEKSPGQIAYEAMVNCYRSSGSSMGSFFAQLGLK